MWKVVFRWRPLTSSVKEETWRVVVILLGKTLLPRLCCEWSTCVCSFFHGWSCPGSCRSLCALLSARSTLMLSGSFSLWLQPKSSVVHPGLRLMPGSYSPWTPDRAFPADRQSTGWSRNLNFAGPDATDLPTSGHVSRCSGSACVLSEDEFGILVDDRCIDTGAFQPRYLVHELVFACSPPPPPRPRVSHTILTQADWCSTRAVARCELGLLPVIQVFGNKCARMIKVSRHNTFLSPQHLSWSQTSGSGIWIWLEIIALVSPDRYLSQRYNFGHGSFSESSPSVTPRPILAVPSAEVPSPNPIGSPSRGVAHTECATIMFQATINN